MTARAVLEKMFLKGETAKLAETPLETFEKAGRPGLLIGALVLSGALERASALAPHLEDRDASGMVSFHMLVGLARAGKTCEAEERLSKLETLSIQAPSRSVAYYAAQGASFLSFFKGHFQDAVESAQEALSLAEVSTDSLAPFARVLSLDLLGHSLIQAGSIRRGLKALKSARDAAIAMEHQGFSHAISISLLTHEASFGFDSGRIVSRLSRALTELRPGDSYSRSELRLELSRQLLLRGRLLEARQHLEAAAHDILGSENQTQTAALHFRVAWLAQLEARHSDALLALASSERALRGSLTHLEWIRKIEGFRCELLRNLGRVSAMKTSEERLRSLDIDSVFLNDVGSRRYLPLRNQDFASGEDPFSELLVRLRERRDEVERELFEKGYFGFLFPLLGVHLGQTALVLGVPGGGTLVLDGGETWVSSQGLTGILGKLLLRLSQGSCSRREAIESIWGYRYEADRHDRLIATAVSRIRRALGGEKTWIQVRGERIVLRDSAVVKFWGAGRKTQMIQFDHLVTRAPTASVRRGRNLEGLRIRQLQVLDDLATRGDIGVQDLVEKFGISRASALRDLAELVRRKLLVRTGETRATRYILETNGGLR